MKNPEDVFLDLILNTLLQSTTVLVGLVVGVILGFLASLIGIFIFAKWLQKKDWGFLGSNESIARIGFLVVLGFFSVPAVSGCGAILGGGIGAHRVINKTDVVETAMVTTLAPVKESFVELFNSESDAADDVKPSDKISISGARKQITDLEDSAVAVIQAVLEEKMTMVPEGAKRAFSFVTKWVAKSKADEFISYGTDVINYLEKNEDSDVVSADRFFAAIGRVHVAPFIQRNINKFVKLACITSMVPVFLISAIPILLIPAWQKFRSGEKPS